MSMTRRSAFAAVAAMLAAPVMAVAQGSNNRPPGGISSSTAPSNSEGSPAGGTGIVGTSRTPGAPPAVGANAPLVGGEMGTSETPRTVRRRRHRHRNRHTHPVAPTPAQ